MIVRRRTLIASRRALIPTLLLHLCECDDVIDCSLAVTNLVSLVDEIKQMVLSLVAVFGELLERRLTRIAVSIEVSRLPAINIVLESVQMLL